MGTGIIDRTEAGGSGVPNGVAWPDPDAIATICKGVTRFVEVDEDSMAEAMRIYYDDTHQVAEGAGAAPLAALMKERERMANLNVCVILSGGNIERARLLQVLGGNTPAVQTGQATHALPGKALRGPGYRK